MTAIELFGAPQSVYMRATRLAFEEKGVAYALTPAAPHSTAILAVNPFGKIPIMRHGTFELFESLAIITYVDRIDAMPSLIPDDAKLAVLAMQWTCAVNTCVFPAIIGYMQAHAFPKGPDGNPDRVAINRELPRVIRQIGILDEALSRRYLAGDAFGIADMYLMPMLAYLFMFPESGEALRSAKNCSLFRVQCGTRQFQGHDAASAVGTQIVRRAPVCRDRIQGLKHY